MPKPPSQPGCAWVEKCIEECTCRAVFVEEEGVRATFIRPSGGRPSGRKLRKVHYDGCYAPLGSKQADYILGLVGVIDVIVELKKSDTNIQGAADQVESTLHAWRRDPKRAPRIAALIVYGRIEGLKKSPGRIPRTNAVILGVVARFLRHGTLLLIEETGRRKYFFRDFAG